MKNQTLVLLLLAVLGIVAGVFLLPNSGSEAPPPVIQWNADDEVDGAEEQQAEPVTAETGEIERTEAELTPGAPAVVDEARVDALLRGRVVDKFNAPVAGAKVWLEIGRSRQQAGGRGGRDRGGRGSGGRSRRIPEPVVTNEQGLFAFQGQAFQNLRVSLQVKSDAHAVGLFEKDVGDIRADQPNSAEVEVALGDLQLKSGGLVRGRVTDLAGNAVLDAEVKMEPDFRNRLRWQRNRDELLPPTTTDSNGYYTYENVPEGRFAVTVLAKMHTPGRSEGFDVAEDAVVEVPDIALGPGYEVTGIVVDARGEPIAKADVRLRASLSRNAQPGADGQGGRDRGGRERGGRERGRGFSFRGMGDFGGRDHRAETDEEGKFFLEHLPGTLMEIRVRAKGFLEHEADEIDPKLQQPIYVTMQDGLRITGLVQTPDGLPQTTYAVEARRLRDLPDPSKPELDLTDLWSKMSNPDLSEDGRRELMRQMRSARDQFSSQFRGRGGERGGRGSERSGRGGRGSERGGREGRNDDEQEQHDGGRFVADGLQEGVYEVVVKAEDYARYQSAEVQVRRDNAAPDLTITLDRGVYVGGVVLDPYGDPIAGAEVTLRSASLDENNPPQMPDFTGGRGGRGGFDMSRMAREWMRGMSGPPQRLEATTDEDGLFIVKNVQRGVYALSAAAEGFSQESLGAFQLNNDRSDFELRLKPLGVIMGTVTGFLPEEVNQVQVGALLIPEDGNIMGAMMRGGMRGGMRGRGGPGGRNMSTGKIQADGTYRLEGLTPGDYLVRTWIGGTSEIMRIMQPLMMGGQLNADVNVRAGAETRWDLQIERPQVGSLVGSVLHNGEFAKGFRVELRPQDDGASQPSDGNEWMARMARWGRNKSGTVKGDGTFEIKDVNAGIYTLRITEGRRGGPLYQEQVQVLADSTLERTFSLTTGSLQGSVATDDGSDAKEIRGNVALVADLVEVPEDLRSYLRENASFSARIRDGAFEVKSLPTGTYLLIAQPRDREQTSQTVVVTGPTEVAVTVGKATQEQNGGAPK
ncbi:MAG: carboxypeptidase-like regulatory domain-containing protein [Planctomycetota bacterium]|nr:carboxypeptidase-like regulatory domain-containing protein [Planctomycetota bacterium]